MITGRKEISINAVGNGFGNSWEETDFGFLIEW